VAACAELHLLSLEAQGWSKVAVLGDAHVCTGCALCAVACPFDAIHMVRRATGTGALE